MEVFLLISVMVIVGAAIGGVTNHLAIKMLFRPYKPIFIGRLKVPFTPGLIPKRREELAEQLGEMVVKHLLTAEGLKTKLLDQQFKKEFQSWLEDELEHFIESEITLKEIIEKYVGIATPEIKLEQFAGKWIEQKLAHLYEGHKYQNLKEIFPDGISLVDAKIPGLAELAAEKAALFFDSQEGKSRLGELIERFLTGKGMFGNMISMFLGNESLVDKVQPEVVKFLRNPTAIQLVEKLLRDEWNRIKEKELKELTTADSIERLWGIVRKTIVEQLSIGKLLTTPLDELLGEGRKKAFLKWSDRVVDLSFQVMASRVDVILRKMNLSQIVRDQVETFSVQSLEDLVLSISRREFKMITYLGALLGGLIGLIQGVIILVIQA